MTKRLSTAFSTFLCLAALFMCAGAPFAAAAQNDTATAAETTATAPDPSTTEAPVTGLTPDQIAELQAQSGTTDTSDKSVFEKASDFVTDNAPFFIIGIVIIAAILAGIFIMRGRGSSKKAAASGVPAASATGTAPGAPASTPSASELRRRKRAAMQRSREEERLRRKAHMEGRRLADPNTPLPLSARLPEDKNPAFVQPQSLALDPIEAEKQAARAPAADAVARSGGAVAPPVPAAPPSTGAIPAPTAPSQTAPAAGVVYPDTAEPDTVYTPAPSSEAAPAPSVVQSDQPTQVNPVSDELPEPAIEAPGLDAHVGEAAAAFAGAAAGGAIASGAAAKDVPAADDVPASTVPASTDELDAEQRLRAKVAEIRAEQGNAPVPAPPIAPVAPPKPEVAPEEPEVAPEDASETIAEDPISPTPSGLARVEERLQASSELRDRTLADAEERLKRIEQQAADAEKRAAFAERLAQLKLDESARERRMEEVMSSIDRAEQRAREAEERSRSAERVASAALEESGGHLPDAPVPESPEADPVPPAPVQPPPTQPWQGTVGPAPESPVAAPTSLPPVPAQAAQPAEPVKSPLFGGGLPGSTGGSGSLNLNSATFEELRDADLSVTQATRILAYRERFGGYRSVEDLEKVPGFPAELIESLRGRISV